MVAIHVTRIFQVTLSVLELAKRVKPSMVMSSAQRLMPVSPLRSASRSERPNTILGGTANGTGKVNDVRVSVIREFGKDPKDTDPMEVLFEMSSP
jgi:hypothetical protein